MKMQGWIDKLDAFLRFNDYEVLINAGSVSAEVAKNLAQAEYEKYRVVQDVSFDMLSGLKPLRFQESLLRFSAS